MRQHGWSLVELMVVCVVLAIVATVSGPAMGNLITRINLTSTTTDFISAVHLTRSTAVRQGKVVVLCPTADGESCEPEGDYADGWLVTNDHGDPGETLRHWPATEATLAVNFPGDSYVRFSPDGLPRQAGGAFLAGTARFCLNGKEKRVIISRNGRVRTEDDEC